MERYAKAEALKEVVNNLRWSGHLSKDAALNLMERAIDNLPAADVVEVVRCKDCERVVEKDGMYVCNHALPTKSLTQYIEMGTDILAIVQPDDFCSYGERRNDEMS